MKAVILAGGRGIRISEETDCKPKPMVEIGGRPLLWHILKIYSSYGIHDFIICCGYLGYLIKEYFVNYYLHTSDITVNLAENLITIHASHSEPWNITLVNTGEHTMTGGRLKRVRNFIGDETFCMTYGDGVSDVNIRELIDYHYRHKLMTTLTAVQLPARFGVLQFDGPLVASFQEKPHDDTGWVNGGFFVIEPNVFEYINGDETMWEKEPLERLTRERQLGAYKHYGFWQPMDTLRDKNKLQQIWESGIVPWKVWD